MPLDSIVSVEVNISIYYNKIDRKIDVTAILILLVENRQQTHDGTLIGSGANGLGIQGCRKGGSLKITYTLPLTNCLN